MIANMSIVLYSLIGLLVITIVWLVRTEMRLKKLFRGKKAADLENIMEDIARGLESLKEVAEKNHVRVNNIDARVRKGIKSIQTVRFNPFPDQGSNQSFAIGMLNEEGDGVVISSLYSRDRISIFAKPIKQHASEFELTEEEQAVIERKS